MHSFIVQPFALPAVRFENIAKWGKRASEPQLAEGEGIFAILYGVYDPFHLYFLSHILPEPCASVCDLCSTVKQIPRAGLIGEEPGRWMTETEQRVPSERDP